MSAGLSATALAELYVANNTEEWIPLVTVTHADFAATLRFVADQQNVTSRSNVYTALAMAVQITADQDAAPRAAIVLCNVDRATVDEFRSITSEALITIEVIRRSDPDTVVRAWPYLRVESAKILPAAIHISLAGDAVFDEAYPGLDFTPSKFPAGFSR